MKSTGKVKPYRYNEIYRYSETVQVEWNLGIKTSHRTVRGLISR